MSSNRSRLPYEIEITIQPEDIDRLGHVNNVVYLRWVQDAAVAHWNALASESEKRALLWVVARHEIDYRRPALPEDTIVARTWVGGVTRRGFERHTELLRKRDGKILATALTTWCPIHAETLKPIEVSDDIYAKFSTCDAR
ncbi:MAG TPA: acyl-CoA thioesterase [Thermoanaerobaculia bacterium]|nr:acyl-CoA thioesterase [Thermoanaerobaculia bacterium]HUM29216.1 acyl-CoA thioesterase [Thermoanaerobaculia bacterium]HXK67825.1 acyl-CoA thioesterase [Thermoanaerobaculia bacterium]